VAQSFPVALVKLAGMFTGGGGQEINQGDLHNVGQKGDGLAMLPKIQAFCPSAVLSLPPFWAYNYASLDGGITDFWMFLGTISINGATYAIEEFVGDLADRATHPNPFTDRDRNGDTGSTLKMRVVAEPVDGYPGIVEVYYGK
jgi:hypothetical protein